MMDDSRQHETGRHKVDYYRASHAPWNTMNQHHHHHQAKEPNALVMNKKIMSIIAERDAAIRERNAAILEKNEALAERDEALRQRDAAVAERDNAIAASLRIRKNNNTSTKRITTAFPLTAISSDEAKRPNINNNNNSSKRKRVSAGEVDAGRAPSGGTKYKTEWGRSEEAGLNLIAFDEGSMPVPVCSCTGAPRQCYKWGSGGWQSSCCTTHVSVYPLPQVPNKRHARMGGRKMSGSVFTRLLTRLALQGHNLSLPLDLKEYWARHGTNRYITIK